VDLQKLMTSPTAVNLSFSLARSLGTRNGYRFSRLVAGLIARQKESNIVRAVRENQRVVRDGQISEEQLDDAVKAVFMHAGRCTVDLYGNFTDAHKLDALMAHTAETDLLIEISNKKSKGGTIITIPHQSNFDLVLIALGINGFNAQVLTYAQPSEVYRLQNDIRARSGVEITPISETVLMRAIRRLKAGGTVVTGIDRPIPNSKQTLIFFGRPALLPIGHIRMALATGASIRMAAIQLFPDEKYHVQLSEAMRMTSHPDPDEQARINGERVLQEAEKYIRQAPEQWLMYYPVWPTRGSNALEVNGA
jgi:lauroyl/myristoyl acyltransferase